MPEECPQAVADLVAQCMDADPTARPSAKEVVALLAQPDAVLDRPLPSRRQKPASRQEVLLRFGGLFKQCNILEEC